MFLAPSLGVVNMTLTDLFNQHVEPVAETTAAYMEGAISQPERISILAELGDYCGVVYDWLTSIE
ncbi:MAG: hypothetical protein AAF485_15995 [Chloroflexota bacterium]